MRIELTASPNSPATTLADVKLYSFTNTGAYDPKFESLIEPATNYLERYTGRKLVNQTWTIWLDRNEYADRLRAYANTITLSSLNVSAINSVTLYAPDNSSSVVSAADYRLSGGILSASNRLAFNDNVSISTNNVRQTDSVAIEVSTGYGAASTDIPKPIHQALSVLISHWKDFGMKSSKEALHDVPSSFVALVRPYMSMEAFV
jgi:uncharacterized phiE125 gp8 family phage protein